MHLMRRNSFGFHWRKCAQTDVQRQKTNTHAAQADFVKQLFREMETGGGSSNGPRGFGKRRLIALAVQLKLFARYAADVRRQRDLAELLKHSGDVWCPGKSQSAMSLLVF